MTTCSIRAWIFPIAFLSLAACAGDPGTGGSVSVWTWLRVLNDAPASDPTPVPEVVAPKATIVEDPDSSFANGLQSLPLIGPMLAVLFGNDLPGDEELAIDARAVAPRTPSEALAAADSTPPQLNILYVQNGRLRAYGASIVIRGTVDDETEVAEVTVNGQLASVKDRSFARRVRVPPGESRAVVRAEDRDGNVSFAQFTIQRSNAGQRQTVPRTIGANLTTPEYRLVETYAERPIPRLEDMPESGVYMILLAGTPSAHIIKMPSLDQCREAVEYTDNAACTFHRGRE